MIPEDAYFRVKLGDNPGACPSTTLLRFNAEFILFIISTSLFNHAFKIHYFSQIVNIV
ncbi:hypothetical protein BBU94A_D06 (plasmid) [Borreliella burgdorferi 94a]|nr:hypothetical protein BBU94A_D06 [Borreliella burgdorferi 94a]